MTKYEKIAEWIIDQDVNTPLKDLDIREIADMIFNEQLTSKGIKLVKDALLARNYTNFKDAKLKDSKSEYEFEFNYNIYWDVPTDDKGNPEYEKTYEEEIEDITRLAEEDGCKVASWKKLTKGPDNISVKFRGNLINLKRLCSHIGVEDLEERAVKIKDSKVNKDIDYLVYDETGNDYYCESLEEVEATIDSLKEEETNYKGVEAYFPNGKVWFNTYEELKEYIDSYNNSEYMNSEFRDCDDLVGKKISWDRRALYGVILSKNDPLTNKTSIEETSTGKVYYVSTRLLNKAIENGEAKIRDSKFKDGYTYALVKENKYYDPEGLDIDKDSDNVLYVGNKQECLIELEILHKEMKDRYSRDEDVSVSPITGSQFYVYFMNAISKDYYRVIEMHPKNVKDAKHCRDMMPTKTPLEYIEEALDKEGIEYEVNDDIYGFNPPYYASISILDPNNIDLADEIICSIVGKAYQVNRDRYGNKSSFNVATEQEDIDEINGTPIEDKKVKDSKFKDANLNTYECSVCYGDNELECFDVQARNITSAKNKAYRLSKYLKGGDCKLYIIQYPEDWDGKTNELRDASLTRKQKLWYGEELEKFIHPQYLRKNYQLKRIKRKRGK